RSRLYVTASARLHRQLRRPPGGRVPQGYRHAAAVQLENMRHPAGGSAKSPEGKPRDVMGRRTGGGEVGQNLADHRRELEAMTGAGRSDDDIGGAGQALGDEMDDGRPGV